jgi:peptide/nickel transport system permease protein
VSDAALVTAVEESARRFGTPTWRRFTRHRGALVGLAVLAFLTVLALGADFLAPYDPDHASIRDQFTPPNSEHLLGTDRIGRDLLSRFLYGGRITLAVGLSAAFLATTIGFVVGLASGTLGGRIDAFLMRVTDVVLSLPSLIAIAVIVGLIGRGIEVVVICIGLLEWPGSARIVRALTLSLREQDFVNATRSMGASAFWIARRHIALHLIPALTVTATFAVASAVLAEAGLSFLGIGVKPPQASWGAMLTDAQQIAILADRPWYWVPPGAAIFLTVLAINLVGDGLRDALDPRE